MSEARKRILARLRIGGPDTQRTPVELPVRRFDWGPRELLARFRERVEAVRGEVHLVGADWPQRLFDLLLEKGARNLLYGPEGPLGPELEGYWPSRPDLNRIPYLEPVESWRESLFEDVDAGFTSCRGAIAETGSLVLWPTPAEPRLMSLVPPIHAVLLEVGSIRSTFHEFVAEGDWARDMPANALLVSGPSKSADIEQTLAYGVHGPKELLVLIRRDEAV